jgi:tryptophan synthase alpha subunit
VDDGAGDMLILKDLPTGVIVGSAVIEEVTRAANISDSKMSRIRK